MSLPIIVYKNLWRDGVISNVSSEGAQFPAEYTQDDSRELFWRRNGAGTSMSADCDLGEALAYDFVAILGHNLTTGATIVITGGDDSSFTNPIVDTLATKTILNIFEILPVNTGRTKRWIRVSITDASAVLQVGVIVVGKWNALNRGPSVPYQRGPQNETEVDRSPSGIIFIVQERPSVEMKGLPFVGLDDASELIVEGLIRECGMFKGFILCLDQTTPNTNSYWLMLTAQEMPSCEHMGYWTWTLEAVGIL